MEFAERMKLIRGALESTPSIGEIGENLNHSLKKMGIEVPFVELVGKKVALKVLGADDSYGDDLCDEDIESEPTQFTVVGEIVSLTCYSDTGELSHESDFSLWVRMSGMHVDSDVLEIALFLDSPGYCRNYEEGTFPTCAQYKIL